MAISNTSIEETTGKMDTRNFKNGSKRVRRWGVTKIRWNLIGFESFQLAYSISENNENNNILTKLHEMCCKNSFLFLSRKIEIYSIKIISKNM